MSTNDAVPFQRELEEIVNRYLADGLENRDRMIDILATAICVVNDVDERIAAGEIPDPRIFVNIGGPTP